MKRMVWMNTALMLLGLLLSSAGQLQAQETDGETLEAIKKSDATVEVKKTRKLLADAKSSVKEVSSTEYYLGLNFQPAEDALRAQLDLGDSAALVVVNIVEESPAEKAGVKKYDVLTKVNGETLDDVADLLATVAKGQEVTLGVIRAGREKSVSVTPTKKPEAQFLTIEGILPVENEELTKRLLIINESGMLLPPGKSLPRPKLPNGMAVTIIREGGKPARISVTQGDQHWEVSEDSLEELPPKVRAVVEPMVATAPLRIQLKSEVTEQPSLRYIIQDKNFLIGRSAKEAHAKPDLSKQLEELSHQMKKMQQDLNELRKSQKAD